MQHHRRQPIIPARSLRAAYPISLRVKLLIGFSIAFSFVFAGTFYWFYIFTINKTTARLQMDMRQTLEGAITQVDVDELLTLYEEGNRNQSGPRDPRYQNQLAWFETVHRIEPRAWLYSYMVVPSDRQPAQSDATTKELKIIYLVDLWTNYDVTKAATFLESDAAGEAAYRVYRDRSIYESPKLYQDKWGSWLSAAAPLATTDEGAIVVLGLDIEAGYVLQVQQAIRNRVLISFITAYGVLFVLLYGLSGILTQRLSKLTQSAQQIGAGQYGIHLSSLSQTRYPDEMSTLAQVFEGMVDSIRTREQQIRQGKQTEDEVRLALQQEKELNELKSRFVSMVSHELRTPLTVIRTSLELLERYGHLASLEKKSEYFKRGRVAVETMTQLLEDVLTIGKTEAGKLEFNPIAFNLEQFCQEIVEEIRLGVGANHAIVMQCHRVEEIVRLDPQLLRSILTNLLTNAVKYSPEHTEIQFILSCLGDHAIFEISDRGIGIPSADQPRLFELFHRARNVSMIRGTGLGLAIVKQCVAHHCGQITFTSQEGAGTTFIVKLPLTID